MNRKYKIAFIFLPVILFLYLLKEIACLFVAAMPVMDPPPWGKEAVWLTKNLNRTQQLYFFEYKKFATVKEISKDLLPNNFDNHKYFIEVKGNAVFSNSMQNDARKDRYIRKHLPVLATIFVGDTNLLIQ